MIAVKFKTRVKARIRVRVGGKEGRGKTKSFGEKYWSGFVVQWPCSLTISERVPSWFVDSRNVLSP